MSDDLVKRLRKQSSAGRANHVSKADRLAAADRIEELEAKLARAVDALHIVAVKTRSARLDDAKSVARTTLAELTGGKDEPA